MLKNASTLKPINYQNEPSRKGISMSDKIKPEQTFIQKLSRASRGDLAILKRASGTSIADSRNALGVFYKYLPGSITNAFLEEMYFIVATLYPFNDYSSSGNFGSTMRRVKQKHSSESTDQRFINLLNSKVDRINGSIMVEELAFRLRQCVKLASSREAGVNWIKLLHDLQWWSHEDRFIQKQWAKAYFSE